MAITAAAFTNGTATNATSANTANLTWVSGRLYLISCLTYLVAGATEPTCTGATQFKTQLGNGNQTRLTTFVYVGDGTTHVKTFDCGATTQTRFQWVVSEWQGTVTTSNGVDAIVQSVAAMSAGSTTISVTLAAFTDAVNNAVWSVGQNNGGAAQTEEHTTLSTNSAFFWIEDQYAVGQDTTPSFTISSNAWLSVGAEIKMASAGIPAGVLAAILDDEGD